MFMLWQIRLKALMKYKIINTEIDYDFHPSNCFFDSQIPIHHLVSKHRCLLQTETAEWVIFADTTKGNSCPFFPSL